MKNACIVFNNKKSGYERITDIFRANGYDFEEIRILYNADTERIRSAVSQLKNGFENIVVVVEKSELINAKASVSPLYKESLQSNERGSGVFADKENTLILVCLQDEEYVSSVCVPYLNRKYGVRREKLVIRTMGANEQHVERLIATARNMDKKGGIDYRHIREYDEDIIELYYGENTPKMLVDDVLRVFAEGLSESVYAMDDTPLATQVVRLLKLRGRKLSVAESFTGGGIAKAITSVSGASEVYFEGLNTYNENSKIKRLGVSEYTIKTVGAVSEQTAYEMAAGLISTGDCDVSIATTGLAGPNTDRSMLPVGLSYIAVGTKERVFVYRYKFDGTREEITQKAIRYALFLAYKQLKNI